MNNWDKSLYLSTVALNSEGKAMDKQKIYTDSLEASVNKLKDAWDKFTTSATDAKALKGLTNAGLGILKFFEDINFNLTKMIALLGSIAALSITSSGFKMPETLKNLFGSFKQGLAGISPKVRNSVEYNYVKENSPLEGNLKDLELNIVKLGQSSSKTSSIIDQNVKMYANEQKEVVAWEGELDAAATKRMAAYREQALTEEQIIAIEKDLSRARMQTGNASLKEIYTNGASAGGKWGGVKAVGKTMLSSAVRGIGTGLMVAQLTEAAVSGIASIFKKKDSVNFDALENKIDEIKKEVNKNGLARTKENLDLLDKIISQTSEAHTFDSDMQEQLAAVIETLGKNITINQETLENVKKGNFALKSLEELQKQYYENFSMKNFAADNKDLIDKIQAITNKEYNAYGTVYDAGASAAGWSSSVLGGAAAGTGAASWAGPFAWIGTIIGIAAGAGIGLARELSGEYRSSGIAESGLDLEAAIETTRENYENESNAKIKEELYSQLQSLESINDKLQEVLGLLKENFAAGLAMSVKQKAFALGGVSAADVTMIQSISKIIGSVFDEEDFKNQDLINETTNFVNSLVDQRNNAAEDVTASYEDFYKFIAEGISKIQGLKDKVGDIPLLQIKSIIEGNMPNLSKAVNQLQKNTEELLNEYKRQSKAVDAQNTLLNSLTNMGIELNMSKENIASMLNLGGSVDTSKILDPAYRKYAQELSDLYEDYWGKDGKIANASFLETEEEIAEEYERAVALKQKEYEIMQKQLEVQEAQNKLYQAQRERDTLVFRDGHFMYESNPSTIQGLQEEEKKAQQEAERLEIEKDIQQYTNGIKNSSERMATALEKIADFLEGDITTKVGDLRELQQLIKDNLAENEGKLSDPALIALVEKIREMSKDYQNIIFDNFKIDRDIQTYDKGGILKGRGYFNKQSIGDEVVLSPTDAPQVLSLLSKTGEFAETVYNANTLLRALTMRDSQIGSLLADSTGGNTIYNVENVNVEEASDIESILDSAQRQISMINPKFVRR